VANPGTHAIAMTGSPQTGRTISARAGLKRRLLELGGNGPTVVLADADPVKAAQAIAPACFYAAGQVCSCAERILVAQDIVEPFVTEMVQQARNWVSGDPQDPKVTMGPQNNRAALDKIAAHIEDAIRTGAEVMVGGRRPDLRDPFDHGYFYEPTVLVGFTPDALINREETFGPVAPIAAFADETDADAYIAACDLGLVSAVFTSSVDSAWRWAEKLRSGLVVVNDFTNYWELHIPFGGASGTNSGVGRLGGRHTLEFMSDLKTIAFHVKT
jgi:acyl-CoA reductase-like NAD-dependent aldehyde dehydrogenase